MAKYLIGEDFNFSDVRTKVLLDDSYELVVDMLLSTIKETEESVVFRATSGGSVTSRPVIEGGRAYFSACDHNVYAIDLERGKKIWSFPTKGPILAGVALDASRVYAISYDGNLYALTRRGYLDWKYPVGDKMVGAPLVYKNNIYVGCRDGNIYNVDKNGNLVWRFHTKGPIGSRLFIYRDVLYAGSFDHNLYSLTLDGRMLWKFQAGDLIGGPTVSNGVVYFGCFDHNLYAVSTKGKLLWKFRTEDKIPVGVNMSAVDDDTIYFGSRDFNVYAVRNGNLVWRFRTGNMIFSRPFVEDGILYIGSSDCNLYALDQRTGKEHWRFTAGGPVLYPEKGGDRILFGSHDCNMYCINTKPELLWKFHTSLDFSATLEPEARIEHTVFIPPLLGSETSKTKTKEERGLGDYGDFKGHYIGNDMRDYIGEPIKQGLPGMAYKKARKVYKK